MEKIKLFIDYEGIKIERLDFQRAAQLAGKVRDFFKGLGITPTPEKIIDFIESEGKSMINAINADLENDLKVVKSEITKARIKKDTNDAIVIIEGFIEENGGFSEFRQNKHLIRIQPDTLKALPVAGYDDELQERHTRYVTNFERYEEFNDVCSRINGLIEKYQLQANLNLMFLFDKGKYIPHPAYQY